MTTAALDGAIGMDPWLTGFRVVMDPILYDGDVWVSTATESVLIGTHPRDDLNLLAWEARWYVRNGLRDVLEWLGEPVGPRRPPTGEEVLQRLTGGTE